MGYFSILFCKLPVFVCRNCFTWIGIMVIAVINHANAVVSIEIAMELWENMTKLNTRTA